MGFKKKKEYIKIYTESMLFYSFFKTLINEQVTVELKNDLVIIGTLASVDQYLNLRLNDISVKDPEKYPHMVRYEERSPPFTYILTRYFFLFSSVSKIASLEALWCDMYIFPVKRSIWNYCRMQRAKRTQRSP
jgi:small nuclear ribonucleoprotein (snRNP)-like protein